MLHVEASTCHVLHVDYIRKITSRIEITLSVFHVEHVEMGCYHAAEIGDYGGYIDKKRLLLDSWQPSRSCYLFPDLAAYTRATRRFCDGD